MAYWIFKCNLDHYELEDRLSDPIPIITWRVVRYRKKIDLNDTVFIWEVGANARISAVLRVDCPPQVMPELQTEQWFNMPRDTEVKPRVLATILHRHVNLPAARLKKVQGLQDLCVFRPPWQGTNFPVTDAQGQIIDDLIAQRRSC